MLQLNARLGSETLERLDRIRDSLAHHAACPNEDPEHVLPAWLFAVDTMRHAARKLAVMGPLGANTSKARRRLAGELSGLMGRHRALWLAQSRPSERRITWRLYLQALRCIQRNDNLFEAKAHIPRGYITRYLVSRPLPYHGKIRALECPPDPTPARFAFRDFPTTLCIVPDLADRYKSKPLMIYYYCQMICRQAMRLSMGLGYDGPIKVWVDRKPVWCDPRGTNPAGTDKAVVALDLRRGTHSVWIALDANKGLATGVRIRLWRQDDAAKARPAKRRPLPRLDASFPRDAGCESGLTSLPASEPC